MNTNRHEDRWTSLAATTSRNEGPSGSAGVPPAQRWHSLTPLSHPARPATAPRFRFSRAQGVPAGGVAVCRITGKPSGHPTQRMRARRPRSRRGASSHPSCSARRHCPCRCGSAVPLRVPSWITLFSLVSDWPPAAPPTTPGLAFGRDFSYNHPKSAKQSLSPNGVIRCSGTPFRQSPCCWPPGRRWRPRGILPGHPAAAAAVLPDLPLDLPKDRRTGPGAFLR